MKGEVMGVIKVAAASIAPKLQPVGYALKLGYGSIIWKQYQKNLF